MKITYGDWLVVAGYFLVNLLIGLYYRKKASGSTGDYFLSGREVSWWLAGTSMVAATFAADTPLAVTGLVATQGIAGNWFWWSMCFSGMMTVFFFARLWRRAEIVTDAELVELRYAGKPAAFLRGFRALYFGILMNCLIVGWVNLAMEQILGTVLGLTRFQSVLVIFGIIAITSFYTFISGLWGVLWTDLIQFVLKMTMVTVLAYYGVRAVGGMNALITKLGAVDAAQRAAHGGTGSILDFIPDPHSAWMPFTLFLAFVGLSWWANWYPGAEPGGGGYVAQRIFSAKDEKHSLGATLWFNIAQYAIRSWPWILTALASIILYPDLKNKETGIGFIKVWVDYLPHAWSGLMLAAFAAAYMSTIATQLNWGSSYIVNDFYRRFLSPGKPERHYVSASKVATALLAVLGAGVSLVMTSVAGAWQLLLGVGAGTGAVYLLRWYWWRINAWSEVSAMTAAAVTTALLQIKLNGEALIQFSGTASEVFAKTLLLTILITSVVWITVTLMTDPEPQSKLLEFYKRVRPGITGWKPIAALAPEIAPVHDVLYNLMDWLLGCLMVYMAMFGIGEMLLGSATTGLIFLVIAAAAGYGIYWDLSRRGWETLSGRGDR
ncbi:MAG TPA: sodium:solute symporter family protein [Terriglobia bacterium]|nr:sodium:solute symporter family protein [Terriglobia bacterium]